MMKTHKASRLRRFGGAAAVTLLAGAGLALGSPGVAQGGAAPPAATPDEAAPRVRGEERIIIRTHQGGEGGHGAHGAHSQGSAPAVHGAPERRVVIMTHPGPGDDRHAAHGGPEVRTIRIHPGEGGEAGHGNREVHRFVLNRGPNGHGPDTEPADCGEGQRSEVNEGEGNHRTRVILCSRGGNATPAQRAERLQSMRDRLANDSELTAEQRTRVSAAIDREIARLRAQ